MLHLFDWVPVFVLAIGIAGLLTDEFSTVTGIVVIVVGAVGIGVFRQLTSSLDARLAQTTPRASGTA